MPAKKKTAAKRSAAPKTAKTKLPPKATVVSSKLSYKGPLFSVFTDKLREPNGTTGIRDVIRHSGSVVILALDETDAADPIVIMEQQYRHAAGQYLWELPAGRREPGESPLAAAKRELIEETGYRAKKWQKLVRYYASPGFLGEWMEIWLARGIWEGAAQPEADEHIRIVRMPLSELLKRIEAGKIMDGKTIIGASVYAARRKQGSS
ncbi:MAG TPA: NUDIX hydrolase [Acidobacteriaceae bacterium]|jgi:ADP-ribose pyrophosphatase|nr:NUDIX hydrolase [Acidobacteriaceae bacterium]